jgi:hypothetical protein
MYGQCVEYVWDMYGIFMEYAWNMYGMNMEYHRICMEHVWLVH